MGNRFGMNPIIDYIKRYKGKTIRVTHGHDYSVGVLIDFDSKNIYLRPVIIYENLFNPDGTTLCRARLERKTPKSICREGIDVEPLRRRYLDDYVKSANAVKPKNSVEKKEEPKTK